MSDGLILSFCLVTVMAFFLAMWGKGE